MGKQAGIIYAGHREAHQEAVDHHNLHLITHVANYTSSQSMATLIDNEVQRILHDGRATAYELLTGHYAQLTKLAETLMKQEKLDRKQFEAVLKE